MAHIQRSITIEAPVHEVYEYWSNPGNWPEVWPSMVEVTDVVMSPNGLGSTHRFVYKMAGIRLEGQGVVECIPDQRIISKSSGGIESSFVWTFEPEGDVTKMTMNVDYTVPVPVIGKMLEAFAVKMNEHEGRVTLDNIKARLEHHA